MSDYSCDKCGGRWENIGGGDIIYCDEAGGFAHECCKLILTERKSKMTRQEAIEKCLATFVDEKIRSGDVNVRQLISCLEALGLIKFDDQDQKLLISDVDGYNREIKVKAAIGALKAYGYEVAMLGKITDVAQDLSGRLLKIKQ